MANAIPKYKDKRVYSQLTKNIPKEWDIIVIGSGMAGMTAAAALSKKGKKVLVLEKHYLPGGFTHMFKRKEFVWDVGIHALGEFKPGCPPYKVLKWIADEEVEFASLGDPYEQFFHTDGTQFNFSSDIEQLKKDLKARFPSEVEQVDAYFNLCFKVVNAVRPWFVLKTLPKSVAVFIDKILGMFTRNWWKVTAYEALKELNMGDELIKIVTSQWGYYGNSIKEASFPIHAMIVNHYRKGGCYPVDGSKSIAAKVIPTIMKGGGQVVCGADVNEVVIENGKAVGVKLSSGEEFTAKKIISAAGAKATLNNILPKSYLATDWAKSILKVKNSPAYLSMHMGFEGDIRSTEATTANTWIYLDKENDDGLWSIDDQDVEPPVLYISFNSLKDTNHKTDFHGAECITFLDYKYFEKWKDSQYQKRDADYKEFKEEISQRLISVMKKHIPKVMEKLTYYELSTPLTTDHFVNTNQGAIYGLDATPERFLCDDLRVRTPVKNFYLSGVDIATMGVAGGMFAGMLTAATIDKRIYAKLL